MAICWKATQKRAGIHFLPSTKNHAYVAIPEQKLEKKRNIKSNFAPLMMIGNMQVVSCSICVKKVARWESVLDSQTGIVK